MTVIIHIVSLRLNETNRIQSYDLDIDWLNSFWHRTALMAVLRVLFTFSKAKCLCRELEPIDSILYKECEREAKTPVTLARCVVQLMNTRDRSKEKESPLFDSIVEPRSQFELYDRFARLLAQLQPKETNTKPERVEQKKRRLEKYGSALRNQDVTLNLRKIEIQLRNTTSETKRMRRLRSPKLIHEGSTNSAVKNLQRIQRYTKLLDECTKQVDHLNENNLKFIRNAGVPFQYSRRSSPDSNVLNQVNELINEFQVNNQTHTSSTSQLEKMSILSPRLLSVFPEQHSNRPRLLSPSLFSFQADEPLSLSQLLAPALGRHETDQWLETLLEMSGASRLLQKTMDQLRPQLEVMEEHLYPKLRQLSEWDRAFQRVAQMHDGKQRERLKTDGYTFLTADQTKLIYDNPLAPRLLNNSTRQLSAEEHERRLERDIRRLAQIDETENGRLFQMHRKWRQKRQTSTFDGEPIIQAPEVHAVEYPILEILAPFAFSSRINEGIALELLILSPHMFFTELIQPEALNLILLSPRAFIPSILSPDAMLARILSPAAFRTEILSPRTMVAWILSPEALILEVLSPKALEMRIGSPEALIIQILSPNALAPKIYSPEALGVLILSPSFLSPRINSGEKLMVEILSPNILGGSAESESKEESSEEENNLKSSEHQIDHKIDHKIDHSHEHIKVVQRGGTHNSTFNW
ncbi:Moulting cycle MLT-10-like protein family-containing protein [Aphelenchoides besseyi]|nr:Moulting cycle MLT-10-like protein family-containing protein [Aphelenchoides besseyi]KAI6223518.1 Moulting cycle MLT-10-like protein family-containing protein [Aphelenchoides besseyi]